MKAKAIFLTALVSMAFACSVSEAPEAELTEVQSVQVKSPIAEILATESGKKSLSALFKPNGSAKGNGNGVIFIENGGGYVGCSFGEEKFVCFYEIGEDGFYAPFGDVRILPNGQAQFHIKSKEFAVEVYNADFELIYSNLCLEDRSGNLHANLKSPFVLIEDDGFVDFAYYSPVFEEVSSANNLQLSTVVNDAARNLDIDLLTWDCVEPTSEKRLSVTSIQSAGGNLNVKIRLK
jgi:hypothetical protein